MVIPEGSLDRTAYWAPPVGAGVQEYLRDKARGSRGSGSHAITGEVGMRFALMRRR
jgi:hypothetical protein